MKCTVVRVILALLLLAVAVRFAWILLLQTSGHQTAASPDKRYVADVSSSSRADFWFGAPHDCHGIKVIAADGRNVRRMVLDDRHGGWSLQPKIHWADDSSSVTVVFEREEVERARVVIPVRGQ